MQFRWLSSFTIIGAILFFIGFYGMAHGPSFQYDKGVQAGSDEGVYYLVVGALMVLNGFFQLPLSPEEKKEQEKSLGRQSIVNKT
jgi:hypothetical protein